MSLHHVKCIGRQLFITGLVHRKVGVRAERSQRIGRHKVATAGSQQTIHKLAGGNTTLTANAASRIDKNRFAHFFNIRGTSACKDKSVPQRACLAVFPCTRDAEKFSRWSLKPDVLPLNPVLPLPYIPIVVKSPNLAGSLEV
jgi:hypothetical protein